MPVSRAALPEEFYDRTSALLLAQPEPQYLFARLFKDALGAALQLPDAIGAEGRPIGGQGADYARADEDRLALSAALPEALFAVKADFRGEPGHTIRFNRPQFTNTTYTEASRRVGANQTISVVPIEAESEQTSLTLERYAGPYDATNSRVAPFALDAFDATLGVHNLAKLVGTHLQRDFDRTIDQFIVLRSDNAANTSYPDGMSADNDATAAGMFPATYEQVNRVARQMDDANLPTLGDGKRILVWSPTGEKQIIDDPQFARYAQGFKDKSPLYPGWFAECAHFHHFKSTTLRVVNNASSVAIHRALAIAPSAYMGGLGKPPRVASANEDNYGETAKVIWLAYLAAGLADNRYIRQVRYSADAG